MLASDHAGWALKEAVKRHLERKGFTVRDFGCFSSECCDYPDFIIPACEDTVKEKCFAIVFGGSGAGECIAANKVRGVRAVVAYSDQTARLAREHNDANVLCLGGRTTEEAKAIHFTDVFLSTPFSEEQRHVRRIKKISDYEK